MSFNNLFLENNNHLRRKIGDFNFIKNYTINKQDHHNLCTQSIFDLTILYRGKLFPPKSILATLVHF